MAVVLGILTALGYGTSDFLGGLGSRRADGAQVTILAQAVALAASVAAVVAAHGRPPTAPTLVWGAVAGVGTGVGVTALYRGLATGRMAVVSPVAALLSTALPAVVGLATGDHLSGPAVAGLVVALPAVLLVAREPDAGGPGTGRALAHGLLAGLGFGLSFVGLARAGTTSGAWPTVPEMAAALVVVTCVGGRRALRGGPWRPARRWGVAAGVLTGVANLAFLAATGRGALAVVAVLAGLYPAVTVIAARVVLHERWSRLRAAGLVAAGAAVALISAG